MVNIENEPEWFRKWKGQGSGLQESAEEAAASMNVGIFIQSSRFWRDLDENLAAACRSKRGFEKVNVGLMS